MTFDPLADIIDLRDVLEVASEPDPDVLGDEARAFLVALYNDLGMGGDDDISDVIAQVEAYVEDVDATVIARRYFVEYAQELAKDVGAISEQLASGEEWGRWPLNCIDWKRAARELEHDYRSFTFDGRDYLIRSI